MNQQTSAWSNIFSINRVGQEKNKQGERSDFQRDFDRLVFSSAFRRLQNKTQVFPLPGSTFVHNRLTHSLEVASVGRSLGKIVGAYIAKNEVINPESEAYEFYKYELPNVIAAGCLAHDIGNPAFGHSGEKAISAYFVDHQDTVIEGRRLRDFFDPKQWNDLVNFEGNANAFRILTHSFKGKMKGGFGLTYTTIASILKYPCDSSSINKTFKHRKKYGFFQSEAATFLEVAEEVNMVQQSASGTIFKRHPFVYLVEAADDICYQIIDMEDAHRLGILSLEVVQGAFLSMLQKIGRENDNIERLREVVDNFIGDENEKIAFLRARCINTLTLQAADVFIENRAAILAGEFNNTLLDYIDDTKKALKEIRDISAEKIYNHDSVIQIEIAGYNVMSDLLAGFVPALLKHKDNRSTKDEKMLRLFPEQFREFEHPGCPAYERVLNALDYISGMTDLYATELYRRLKGIDIPLHQ